jgi:hypothetical protein
MTQNEPFLRIGSVLYGRISIEPGFYMRRERDVTLSPYLLQLEPGEDGSSVRMTVTTLDGKPLHGLIVKNLTSPGTKEPSIAIEY